MSEKKCTEIKDVPGLLDGFACCSCKTYNSNYHSKCRHCGHERCYLPEEIKVPVPEEKGIRIISVKTTVPEDKKDIN